LQLKPDPLERMRIPAVARVCTTYVKT
jgi:hypothetical protein